MIQARRDKYLSDAFIAIKCMQIVAPSPKSLLPRGRRILLTALNSRQASSKKRSNHPKIPCFRSSWLQVICKRSRPRARDRLAINAILDGVELQQRKMQRFRNAVEMQKCRNATEMPFQLQAGQVTVRAKGFQSCRCQKCYAPEKSAAIRFSASTRCERHSVARRDVNETCDFIRICTLCTTCIRISS